MSRLIFVINSVNFSGFSSFAAASHNLCQSGVSGPILLSIFVWLDAATVSLATVEIQCDGNELVATRDLSSGSATLHVGSDRVRRISVKLPFLNSRAGVKTGLQPGKPGKSQLDRFTRLRPRSLTQRYSRVP